MPLLTSWMGLTASTFVSTRLRVFIRLNTLTFTCWCPVTAYIYFWSNSQKKKSVIFFLIWKPFQRGLFAPSPFLTGSNAMWPIKWPPKYFYLSLINSIFCSSSTQPQQLLIQIYAHYLSRWFCNCECGPVVASWNPLIMQFIGSQSHS